MVAAQRRLHRFRALIADFHRKSEMGVGFVLWDGSTVPTDLAADTAAVVIGDEGVVAALVRRPNLETLVNLWAAGRIDLRKGTLFDLVEKRPRIRTRQILDTVGRSRALGTLLSFAFVSRGGPWPLEAIATQRSHGVADSKDDIQYHYDISNRFYALWLDREMVYTCGYCTDWSNDIDQIQRDKLEMVCRKLRLKPGETMLDLGCGWGALVCYAAQHYGVTAYGVTLSQRQVDYAKEKIARLGLETRVRIELKDYSEVEGTYEKVASIGMHEHVGFANHAKYYASVRRSLKDGGLFLNHAITRPAKRDQRAFRRKRPEAALMTKYIFPGSEVDHIGNTVAGLERAGFDVHDVEGWGRHYALTCKHWHDRLLVNYDEAVAEVGDIKARMWLAYLAGTSIAFQRSTLGLYQTLASKRRHPPPDFPPTRAHLYRDMGDTPAKVE
ncbi:MAG: cyclopropane-fatty-acyl-phospholipid synthase [Gammaproteobacteria bacterium]|nr:cyclopropane-fatty-acyl-phospholipid synthase [Gammaproteobacteria bacterium]